MNSAVVHVNPTSAACIRCVRKFASNIELGQEGKVRGSRVDYREEFDHFPALSFSINMVVLGTDCRCDMLIGKVE